MKRLLRWIFGALAVLSLFLFLGGIKPFFINLIGDDWAMLWSWHGALISIDSYEDITDAKGNVVANSITVRRFNHWPSKVPFHFGGGPVEAGSEVPYPRGTDPSFQVWVNKDNQPIDHHDNSGHYYGPVEATSLLQVRERHGGWLLFFILTASLPIGWVVHLCLSIGRHASKGRFPVHTSPASD